MPFGSLSSIDIPKHAMPIINSGIAYLQIVGIIKMSLHIIILIDDTKDIIPTSLNIDILWLLIFIIF